MSNPIIKKDIEIDSLTIYPGEILTVYVSKSKRGEYAHGDRMQVEIRLNNEDKLEIFSDEDHPLKSFNDWYKL